MIILEQLEKLQRLSDERFSKRSSSAGYQQCFIF